MLTKAQRKAKVKALRKQFKQSPTASRYFCNRAAIRAEKTPEANKALKAMVVQYHGKRFPHPGLYWAPAGAISARS